MAIVKPFKCIRPNTKDVASVAALPYDVYSRAEAKEFVKDKPLSFLNIDRPETQFDDSFDMYSEKAYQTANELLEKMINNGTFISDDKPAYYIYELIMDGRHQTGIVAASSVDDYLLSTIKKHENTRADKEIDRINHVDYCSAQTGPIFLAYRKNEQISAIVNNKKLEKPLYAFTSEDGITHNVWEIAEENLVKELERLFLFVPNTYIADGHHRAASAVKVALKRRDAHPDFDGTEEFNFFLSVLFPDEELMIMDYNRVVKDLNGYTEAEFLDKVSQKFNVTLIGPNAYKPECKGTFGLYMDKNWYKLEAKDFIKSDDAVKGLDVSVLQDNLLDPILGIKDPKTDKRIDFVGGIRGLKELERRANSDMKIAISMYPTSIAELFAVADNNMLMPPKSTWFEPKLRSGIFIHKIER